MSLGETANILSQTMDVIYQDQSVSTPPNTMRQLDNGTSCILDALKQMETNMNVKFQHMDQTVSILDVKVSKLDVIEQQLSEVSMKVSDVEGKVTNVDKRCADLEKNYNQMEKGVKQVDKQRNEIRDIMLDYEEGQDGYVQRLKNLEEEQQRLKDRIIDLQCRSMQYNLIFSGIEESNIDRNGAGRREDTEVVLRNILEMELDIRDSLSFHNVHRIGRQEGRGEKGRSRQIIAKFVYHTEMQDVLSATGNLAGKKFNVRTQFPVEIEEERKLLYRHKKDAKKSGAKVRMYRDKLYVNDKLFTVSEEERQEWKERVKAQKDMESREYQHQGPSPSQIQDRKRQRMARSGQGREQYSS